MSWGAFQKPQPYIGNCQLDINVYQRQILELRFLLLHMETFISRYKDPLTPPWANYKVYFRRKLSFVYHSWRKLTCLYASIHRFYVAGNMKFNDQLQFALSCNSRVYSKHYRWIYHNYQNEYLPFFGCETIHVKQIIWSIKNDTLNH